MGSPLYIDLKVSLSPMEQRYLASCHCPVDYPKHEKTERWKDLVRDNSYAGETLEIKPSQILEAFPSLANFIASEGLGYKRSVQSYFEGMDSGSHNIKLLEYVSVFRDHPYFERMLEHADLCSVKLARTDGSKIWTPKGAVSGSLDDMFDVFPSSDHVLVHGQTENGHVITREATYQDLERLSALPEMWKEVLE